MASVPRVVSSSTPSCLISQQLTFSSLPEDCLEAVFAFLSISDKVALGAASPRMNQIMKFPGAWPVLALVAGRANDALLSLLFKEWKLQPEVVSLAEGDITDAGLAALETCQSIKCLDLSRCTRVTDAGLRSIAHLPLRALNLFCCFRVTDQSLPLLAALPVEELSLASCRQVTDAGVAHLRGAPIRSLKLSGCSVTDAGVQSLRNLRQLTSLSLSRCPISNAALGHLIGLPLSTLELVSVSITSAGLVHLRALPLKKLFLKDCMKLTDRSTSRSLCDLPLELIELPSGKRRTEPFGSCVAQASVSISAIDASSLSKESLFAILDEEVQG